MKGLMVIILFHYFSLFYSSKLFNISEEKNVLIFGSNQPGIYLFRRAETHSQLDAEFEKAFNNVHNKMNLVFVISDIKEEIEMRTASILKIKPNELPQVIIYDTTLDDVEEYKMTEEINSENILHFINKIFNSKLRNTELYILLNSI